MDGGFKRAGGVAAVTTILPPLPIVSEARSTVAACGVATCVAAVLCTTADCASGTVITTPRMTEPGATVTVTADASTPSEVAMVASMPATTATSKSETSPAAVNAKAMFTVGSPRGWRGSVVESGDAGEGGDAVGKKGGERGRRKRGGRTKGEGVGG